MGTEQLSVGREYEKTMENVLRRFADSKENEADDIELDGKQYNANSSNIGNNRLNKMKRQIMKRGQY